MTTQIWIVRFPERIESAWETANLAFDTAKDTSKFDYYGFIGGL